MENINSSEWHIIKNLHLRGRGIVVIAHAPQKIGGCHPFEFLRGVMSGETHNQAFNRVKTDILQHIQGECGRQCKCNSGNPLVRYRKFGK